MKVLVTGGAGFIGSHIVEKLVDRGHEVVVVDNLVSGVSFNVNKSATIYVMDIKEAKLHQVFIKEKPEFVIHHAAQVDVQKSLMNPAFDAEVNIIGTVNVLECCRKGMVKKIIYASSAAVYGNPEYLGTDEEHIIKPISHYGVSKYAAEKYIQFYQELYGLNYTILRYSNVYGTCQGSKGEGGVVFKFLNNILNDKQPIIFGSGEQTRDFIFADDVADANLIAIYRGGNDIYNISTGKRHSVNELLKIINKLIESNVSPIKIGAVEGDILHSYLDNSKAKEILGWQPKYTLEEGLHETIKYYRNLFCDRKALSDK